MTIAATYTAIVLIVGIVLFAINRFPMDMVALGMLLVLAIAGILDAEQVLSGFGASATVTLGAMYVISGAMRRAGSTALISLWLLNLGGSSGKRLTTVLLASTAALSALIANLATMVIMLPVGLRLSRASNLRPGKILMPLGLFSILGGYLSLLGTSPNLVISDLLAQQTGERLGVFEPAIVALPIVILSLVWVVFFGQRLLPSTKERPKQMGPNLRDLEHTYAMSDAFYRLRVRSVSDLVGRQLDELNFRDRWGVNIVGVAYPGGHSFRPWRDLVLEVDLELIASGKRANVLQLATIHRLEPKGSVSIFELARLSPTDSELAEVMIPPYSPLVGHTLETLNFSETYHLNVLAILREDKASAQELLNTPLLIGDRLLVEGEPKQLLALREGTEIVVLSDLGTSAEDLVSKRSSWMLFILAGVVLLSISGVVSLAVAALLGAFVSILTRCTSVEGAYEDMDVPVLIFVAALLPLGTAITDSGLATAIGTAISTQFGGMGPHVLLALLVLVSVALTQVLANTIVALVMAPIAFNLTQTMDVNATPFAIALLLAVSTAFLTPITEVINLLVRKPGGYQFRHYLALNIPVLIIVVAAAIWLTPLFWPF